MEEYEGAIGIDLGTTYSCVAVWRQHRVEVIPNQFGNRTTPSVVAFNADGSHVIGESAKNLLTKVSSNVLYDAKRLIGKRLDAPELKDDMPTWPFKVVAQSGSGLCAFELELQGEKKVLPPEQVSGLLLQKLKETAEAFVGKKVKKAVITVPAYFNDGQRERTKAAGEVAGLQVLRVINEPTAAALAYGLDKKNDDEVNVLVFDLGGGTFDVTVVGIDNGIFEVKSTAGDTHLGGQDFDREIVKHMIDVIQQKTGKDVTNNDKVVRKLRKAAEHAKCALSFSSAHEIVLEDFLGGDDFSHTLTRAKFEELCSKYFKACIACVKKVLSDASLEKTKIDEIVMVGGSSRIPKVQQVVSEFFGGKALNHSINPDDAIAYGAAVQASILSGCEEQKSEKTGGLILIDVTPLSVGIEVDGGKMDVIISRNSRIPREASRSYTTTVNNQDHVDIKVFEGERPVTKQNHQLGEFSIRPIRKAKKGVPDIKVKFAIDANGLLTVTAMDKSIRSGAKTISVASDSKLSQADIDKMIKDAERFRVKDQEQLNALAQRNHIERLVDSLRQKFEKIKESTEDSEEKKRLAPFEDMVEKVSAWLDENPEPPAEAAEQSILRLNKLKEKLAAISPDSDEESEEDEPADDDDEGEDADDSDSETIAKKKLKKQKDGTKSNHAEKTLAQSPVPKDEKLSDSSEKPSKKRKADDEKSKPEVSKRRK
ncbi:Heat shock protein 70 A1 [Diplonema papillatum]|nr:Heat shock protein 70 A1 [Diplonema papillatum]WGM49988.1 HSPA-3 [Diplonema papillatum]